MVSKRRKWDDAALKPKVKDQNFPQYDSSTVQVAGPISESPQEKALSNLLILDNVMRNLPTKDLKNFRLLNEAWRESTTSELLRRDAFVVRLKFFGGRGRNIFQAQNRPERMTRSSRWSLASLNEILQNSSKFPSNFFSFRGGNLASVDVQNFLSIFGPKIKSLHLHSDDVQSLKMQPVTLPHEKSDDDGIVEVAASNKKEKFKLTCTSKQTLMKILMEHAPNIRQLKVEGFDLKWDKEVDQLSLPSLKNFVWGGGYEKNYLETTEQILRGAKNLESIVNFNPFHIDLLLRVDAADKVKTLRRFDNVWSALWDSEATMKFADTRPQLREFQLTPTYLGTDGHRRLSSPEFRLNPLTKILISSRLSLEKLELCGFPLNWDPVLSFPPLVNLKVLSLKDYWQSGRFFPLGLDLTSAFPNLQILSMGPLLDFRSFHDEPEHRILGNLLTVSCLEINAMYLDENILTKMHRICPNLKKFKFLRGLSMGYVCLVHKICDLWPQLEVLELTHGSRANDLDINSNSIYWKTLKSSFSRIKFIFNSD